jgi:hypothetical protein
MFIKRQYLVIFRLIKASLFTLKYYVKVKKNRKIRVIPMCLYLLVTNEILDNTFIRAKILIVNSYLNAKGDISLSQWLFSKADILNREFPTIKAI